MAEPVPAPANAPAPAANPAPAAPNPAPNPAPAPAAPAAPAAMPTLDTPPITPKPADAPAPNAVSTVKLGDEWKHLPAEPFTKLGEHGQKAAEAAITAIQADRAFQHTQRVEKAQGWMNELKARPTFEADRALVNAELLRTANPKLIAFLNESGAAVHPEVFAYLLDNAKRNSSAPVVHTPGTPPPAQSSEQAVLNRHYPSMAKAG